MATASHRWCQSCHARRVDKRAAYGMCAPCKRVHKKRLTLQRSEMKHRRADREAMYARLATQANPETPEDPEPEQEDTIPTITLTKDDLPLQGTPERATVLRDIKNGRVAYRRPMTAEQEVEMLDAYTQTHEPIAAIASRYGVAPTYPYVVLERAGVTWRRDHAESFDAWQAAQARTQEPTQVAAQPEIVTPPTVESVINARVLPPEIEAMRNVTVRSSAPAPEPVTEVRDLLPAASDEDEMTWEVAYTGKMLVRAPSIDAALARARADGHITTVVSVALRSRG